MLKKPFRYFAIRVANTVVFRRTTNKVQKAKSVLYKPKTDFKLEQVTYTGGRVIGCMPYTLWVKYGGAALSPDRLTQLSRDEYRALDPYIYKEL